MQKKRKRGRQGRREEGRDRRSRYYILLFAAFLAAVGLWFTAKASYGAHKVIYKEARPKKELKKKKEIRKRGLFAKGAKPDPFVSYLVRREKVLVDLEDERRRRLTALERLKAMQEAKTALQKLELNQLKITAIVTGKDSAWAMVQDSKGMGYVVKKGVYIGTKGGVVEKIVRETQKTQFGKKTIRKIIIKEPYINDEGVIEYKLVEMDMAESTYD